MRQEVKMKRTTVRLPSSLHKELKLAAMALSGKAGHFVTMETLIQQAVKEILKSKDILEALEWMNQLSAPRESREDLLESL